MKKILSMMLALALAASLGACGGAKQEPAPAADPAPSAQQPANTEPAQTASGGQQTAPAQTGETKPAEPEKTEPQPAHPYTGHLHLVKRFGSDMAADEFDGTWQSLGSYKNEMLYLDDEHAKKYPELQKALEKFSSENADLCQTMLDDMMSTGREMHDAGADLSTHPDSTWEISVYVTRADDNLLSFVEETYSYMGGVHPDYIYRCFNYDPQTGKEIEFTDLVKDEDAFKDLVAKKLSESYPEVFESYDEQGMKSLLTDWFRYVNTGNAAGGTVQIYQPWWFAGNQGLTVIFNEYDIAPYAAGTLTATVLYDEAPELFDMEWLAPAPDYVTPLISWWGSGYDLGHDGTLDEIWVETEGEYDDMIEEYYINSLSLTVGEETSEQIGDLWCSSVTPYIVHTQDGCDMAFIFCENMYEGFTEIFDVTDGIGYAGQVYGWYGYDILTDPSYVPVWKNCNVAGTFMGSRIYKVGEYGSFYSDDPWYTLETDIEMTTIDVLDLPLCKDPSASEFNDIETLPAGTGLLPLRTNDSDWIDLKDTSTGDEYRMFIETGEYESDQYLPDGRSLYDVFEIVYWAG